MKNLAGVFRNVFVLRVFLLSFFVLFVSFLVRVFLCRFSEISSYDDPLETHNLPGTITRGIMYEYDHKYHGKRPEGRRGGEWFAYIVCFVFLSFVLSFFPPYCCLFFGEFFIDLDDDPLGVLNVLDQFPKVRMSEKCRGTFFVRFRTARMYWGQDY